MYVTSNKFYFTFAFIIVKRGPDRDEKEDDGKEEIDKWMEQ